MENKDDEIVNKEEVVQDTTENTENNAETINQDKTEPGTDIIKVENSAEDEDDKIKKAKLGERLSLAFRKRWIVSGTITLLLVLCIIAAYISINLWAVDTDLPNWDVTDSQIFTLSEESKKAIKDINKEITIYTFGYEEESPFVKFVKQYTATNSNIKWLMLNNETNLELMKEIGDSYNSTLVIVISGDKRIIITPDQDFATADYVTGNTVDTTEEKMTNTILSLAEENQPNIYFSSGHNEYVPGKEGMIYNMTSSLADEAYNVETINLLTTDIPDNCDILAIVSPTQDLSENEANKVIAYINKGKNLFVSKDMCNDVKAQFPNLQKVLDLYGVTIENNGLVVETSASKAYTSPEQNIASPVVFFPELSSTHEITADLYSEQSRLKVLMSFTGRLKFVDDATLSNLNVSKEVIVSSSDTSGFAADFSKDAAQAIASAEMGVCDIGATLTKTISAPTTEEGGEEKSVESKLVVFASSTFFNDEPSIANSNYPNVYSGNNRDLILNSFSYLANKEYTMTIRKTSASSQFAYVPSDTQSKVVLAIIFIFPICIVLIGIFVFAYRRIRK
ncbi:MAG: GldG family protein [Clostridia bacterium]|nr:GldG family protein [Clostridia bacterium]